MKVIVWEPFLAGDCRSPSPLSRHTREQGIAHLGTTAEFQDRQDQAEEALRAGEQPYTSAKVSASSAHADRFAQPCP